MNIDHVDASVASVLAELEVEYQRHAVGQFLVTLAGARRLRTPCWLVVGDWSLLVQAFVCRQPDEDHESVYRFLLQRNARLYGVNYAVDRVGDIHLVGRLPLASITTEEVDRILGQILQAADGDFNMLLELGFASSIRREFAWRRKHGESLANLQAFERLFA